MTWRCNKLIHFLEDKKVGWLLLCFVDIIPTFWFLVRCFCNQTLFNIHIHDHLNFLDPYEFEILHLGLARM